MTYEHCAPDRVHHGTLPRWAMTLAAVGDVGSDYKEAGFRAEWRITLSAIQCGWGYDELYAFLLDRDNQAGLRLHKAEDRSGSAGAHKILLATWRNAQRWIAAHPAGDTHGLVTEIIEFGAALGRRPELFASRYRTIDHILVERIMGLVIFKARRRVFGLTEAQAMNLAGLGSRTTVRKSLRRLVAADVLRIERKGGPDSAAQYSLNTGLVLRKSTNLVHIGSALNPPENDMDEVGALRPLPPVDDLFVQPGPAHPMTLGLSALRVYELLQQNERLTVTQLAGLGVPATTARRGLGRLTRSGLVVAAESGYALSSTTIEEVSSRLEVPAIREARRVRERAAADRWRSQRDERAAAINRYRSGYYGNRRRPAA